MNLNVKNRLCELGSDGASVMLGVRGGVSKLLKDEAPFLVANHCIAHRLALACGQSSNEITYLKRFESILDQLYRFYENLAVRTAGLRSIQEVLDDPLLKLTQAKDVRWLPHKKAVSHLRQCFSSVIVCLEREASERSNAEAAGLLTFIKFVASLYMMSDFLPPLASLSRAFQRKDLYCSETACEWHKSYSECSSCNAWCPLPDALAELEEYGVRQPSDQEMQDFKRHVYNKYLDALSEHITHRFPDIDLLEAFAIFDASRIPQELELQGNHSAEELEVLTSRYSPYHVVNRDGAKAELRVFNSIVAANKDLKELSPHHLMTRLLETPELNANLVKLAAIGLLLPMSTADCERGFSTLSRVKTDLRNRLSSESLNNLLMVSIEGPAPDQFPYNQACNIWASWRQRMIDVTQ